jgi:hypothetical protein
VYRYKQKGYCPNENRKSDKIRAEPVSKNQNSEHISHPFSDEWRCEKCLHRFTSLEFAEEHFQKKHVQKVPYETEPNKENIPVKQALNIQDLLNEMAHQRASELAQSRYAPREGIVKQQLFFIPEPQVEPREEPKQERPNSEIDSKPQSTAVIDIFKKLGNIFKGQNQTRLSKDPIPETTQIFMPNRGVGVDGVSISYNPKPNYCEKCRVWLYDIEVQQHVELGHTVVRQG